MSDPAIPPVVPPPEPSLWQSSVYLMHALGRLPLWHVAQGGAGCVTGLVGVLWRNSPNIAGTLVIVAVGVLLAMQKGCTLPFVPPSPVQPTALEQEIRTAYVSETDPAKAVNAAKLASLLGQAIAAARADTNVKTVGDVEARNKNATDNLIGSASLPVLRKAIGAYLDTKLPIVKTTPMTDQIWLQASAEFSRVKDAILKGAK